MSFVATDLTSEPRSFSLGPLKCQILTYTAASGDTSGTITADQLKNVANVILDASLVQTAAATFSGNVATIAFSNPGITVYGTCLVFGS